MPLWLAVLFIFPLVVHGHFNQYFRDTFKIRSVFNTQNSIIRGLNFIIPNVNCDGKSPENHRLCSNFLMKMEKVGVLREIKRLAETFSKTERLFNLKGEYGFGLQVQELRRSLSSKINDAETILAGMRDSRPIKMLRATENERDLLKRVFKCTLKKKYSKMFKNSPIKFKSLYREMVNLASSYQPIIVKKISSFEEYDLNEDIWNLQEGKLE